MCSRLDLSKETRLLATTGEVQSWVDEARQSLLARKKGTKQEQVVNFVPHWPEEKLEKMHAEHPQLNETLPFSFITEVFWLTLRAMHVGVLKSMAQQQTLVRRLVQLQQVSVIYT